MEIIVNYDFLKLQGDFVNVYIDETVKSFHFGHFLNLFLEVTIFRIISTSDAFEKCLV